VLFFLSFLLSHYFLLSFLRSRSLSFRIVCLFVCSFQSNAWRNIVADRCYELKTVYRQQDPEFIAILNEVRKGEISQKSLDRLNQCKFNTFENDGIEPTRLCKKNDDNNEKKRIHNINLFWTFVCVFSYWMIWLKKFISLLWLIPDAHKEDVNKENEQRLKALEGETVHFSAIDWQRIPNSYHLSPLNARYSFSSNCICLTFVVYILITR
jgi:hypothetical protein